MPGCAAASVRTWNGSLITDASLSKDDVLVLGAQCTVPGEGRHELRLGYDSPMRLWLDGDVHVHDDHSSDGSLPRQRARDRAVSIQDSLRETLPSLDDHIGSQCLH